MLRWRLASAGIIVSVLLTLAWLDFHGTWGAAPGVWLMPVLVALSGMGAEEVLDLLRTPGHRPCRSVTIGGSVLLTAAFGLPVWESVSGIKLHLPGIEPPFGLPALLLVALTMLLFACEMARFRAPGSAITNVALGLFTIVYVGGLLGFLALLRLHHSNAWGLLALLTTLVITKVADTGAYAAGKNLGRTKLTPILSPGKTIEGALGGIIAACLAAWLMFTYAPSLLGISEPAPAPWRPILFGLLLAIAGMQGDLAESLLKRDMQRKDSSTWLRGLGGVLDIIDSVLFAAPLAYLCWLLGLIGPASSP